MSFPLILYRMSLQVTYLSITLNETSISLPLIRVWQLHLDRTFACLYSGFIKHTIIIANDTSRLTHWGCVTHICVDRLTIIGSDNGLSPRRRQAIIWTNAGILLIEPLGTNFTEILISIQIFSFKKMRLKMSSAKWRPFCLGLNVLKTSTRKYAWICERGQSNVF